MFGDSLRELIENLAAFPQIGCPVILSGVTPHTERLLRHQSVQFLDQGDFNPAVFCSAGPIPVQFREECNAAVVADAFMCVRVLTALAKEFSKVRNICWKNFSGAPLAEPFDLGFLKFFPGYSHTISTFHTEPLLNRSIRPAIMILTGFSGQTSPGNCEVEHRGENPRIEAVQCGVLMG